MPNTPQVSFSPNSSGPETGGPRLTILVPALNEQTHLADSIGEAIKAAEQAALSFEIIVINDGSTDATGQIADQLATADPRIHVVHNPRNLGLGGAYKQGLAAARGEYLTWVPADNSHPADGLMPAYSAIGRADLIVPVPGNPRIRSRMRRVSSRAYGLLLNFLLGLDVPYYNGLVVHRMTLLRSIEIKTNSFGFMAEGVAKLIARGHSFLAVGTYITDRTAGRSAAFKMKNVGAVLATILSLFYELRVRPALYPFSSKAAQVPRRRERHRPATRLPPVAAAAAAFAIVLCAAYSPVVFFGYSLQPSLYYPFGISDQTQAESAGRKPANVFNLDLADPAYTLWPINKFVGDAYRSGEIPLWNPYQGGGEPLAAQYSTRSLSPYQIVENLAPPYAWDFFMLGRLWVGGFLAFLFLRLFSVSWVAAFTGGLVYMLSGCFVWFIALEQMANISMVVPGLLAAAELLIRAQTGLRVTVAAATVALVLLGGQPEAALYVIVFAGLYVLVRLLWRERAQAWSTVAWFALAASLGLLLAAPQVLLFVDQLDFSHNIHPPGGTMGVRDPVPGNWLAAFLFPNLYSLPRPFTQTPTNGLWDYVGGYSGVAAVILIVYGWCRGVHHRRELYFFSAVAAFMLLKHAGVPPFVWIGYLPLFDQIWSQRWAAPVTAFAIAAASGFAMDSLWRSLPQQAGLEGKFDKLSAATTDWSAPVALIGLMALPAVSLAASRASTLIGANVFAYVAGVAALCLALVLLVPASSARLGGWLRAARADSLIRRAAAMMVVILAMTAVFILKDLPRWRGPVYGADGRETSLFIILTGAGALASAFAFVSPRLFRRLTDWVRNEAPAVLSGAIAVTLLSIALFYYPATNPDQRAYLLSTVVMGALTGLGTTVIAIVLIRKRHAMGSAASIALLVLISAELIYAIPRGYLPQTEYLKVVPWLIAIIAVLLAVARLAALSALAVVVSIVAIAAVDFSAPSGFPPRRDPFATAPYVDFLRSRVSNARVIGVGGILMPNFASALGLQDVHYIQAIAPEWMHRFATRHLQEVPPLAGVELWFTGYPIREFTDLSLAKTTWWLQDYTSRFFGLDYSGELAVERAKRDIQTKLRNYSFLGVRYFILPRAADLNRGAIEGAQLPLVYDGEVRIYENPFVFPRAFIVHEVVHAMSYAEAQDRFTDPAFDPLREAVTEDVTLPISAADPATDPISARASIVKYRNRDVQITADLDQPGLLVLTDVYDPGWQATVDGASADIIRVNGLVRGVWLAAGQHAVVFSYRPVSFTVGAFGAGAAAVVCILLMLLRVTPRTTRPVRFITWIPKQDIGAQSSERSSESSANRPQ